MGKWSTAAPCMESRTVPTNNKDVWEQACAWVQLQYFHFRPELVHAQSNFLVEVKWHMQLILF